MPKLKVCTIVNGLEQSIITAVACVDGDMFLCVWIELDCPVDICRVTKGSHLEHL
jgi:hypothetical protein